MLPIPLFVALPLVGAIHWPVTLAIAALVATLGFVLRTGWARVLCFGVAALLAADCLLALWLPGD